MLPLRTRIFIIISLIVLLVLGVSVLVSVLNKRPGSTPVSETPSPAASLPAGTVVYNGQQVVVAPIASGLKPPAPPTTLEAEQNAVRQLARIFAERYYSYSTDSNYQNIRELKDLVTSALWEKISKPLSSGASADGAFTSLTTNVLSNELASWQDDAATVTVRATSVQDKNGVVSTQARTGTANLVKVDEQWLVDKFAWEK